MSTLRPLNYGYGVRYGEGSEIWLNSSTFVEILRSARTNKFAVIARAGKSTRIVYAP